MKKILICLMATVLTTNISFSNELKTKCVIDDYFSKPIFKLIKEYNQNLHDELVSSTIQKMKVDGVDVVFIQLQNGYFLDDSTKMVYSEINKPNNQLIMYDFTSNYKTTFKLIKNSNNVYSDVDKTSVQTTDLFNPQSIYINTVTFNKECRDLPGFALCYAGALLSSVAIAASDGPLPFMDVLAVSTLVTNTALCIRSWC